MREILFRGKSISGNDWIYGSLVQLICECNNVKIFPINSKSVHDSVSIDLKTIGQFTGLIDKNGKQIFEGDVIHHGDASELCLVTYIESGFYSVPTSKEKHTLSLEMWLSACVVIGNIFDNPELVSA